jgi:hypothetical protein
MKTVLVSLLCSTALATGLLAQAPPPPPAPSAPAQSPAIAPSGSVSPSPANDLERSIEKRLRKHFNFSVGGDDEEKNKASGDHVGLSEDDMGAWMAVPIVAIIFSMVFGAPVAIVFVIMLMNYFKARSLHRTVRTMVEKGQPVPEALFAKAPAIRQRSDMRRGIVLVMVGLGLMLFLAAVNAWEGGAWALGIIPFMIGAGYLLVWKLEGKKDIPPPPPVA